ncbi:MAG: hypothetical protein WDN04_00160 [Rhodospirillales bacterium]
MTAWPAPPSLPARHPVHRLEPGRPDRRRQPCRSRHRARHRVVQPRSRRLIIGNEFGPNQSYSGNGLQDFFIPAIGYSISSHPISPSASPPTAMAA